MLANRRKSRDLQPDALRDRDDRGAIVDRIRRRATPPSPSSATASACRARATHLLLPVQFSHCLVVANGAAARLTRADLFLTLLSFSGKLDAVLEIRFGLFVDNACRLRDGADNKALGL
jgi:hypothetical protein